MKIQVKNLTLVNFKGIRNRSIDLNPEGQSFIFGNNATGKTTIFDAFTWLLFGKDSQGRSDFEVKTIDVDGTVIAQIEHEVTGTIIVDGKESIIKRVLREKWVKKRGSESTEFEGNETLLFVNDVPKKAGEFKDFVSSLINEQLFKLITSPTAFNSLPWQERRTILTSICGGVSNDSIVASLDATPEQKQQLLNLLASGQELVEYKKSIAARIKKFKDELKAIPTRIDEVERSKPELTETDLTKIVKQIEALTAELSDIDSKIIDKSKAFDGEVEKINTRKKELVALQTNISNRTLVLKSEVEKEISERNQLPNKLKAELSTIVNNIADTQREIDNTANRIELLVADGNKINEEILAKRKEWTEVNAKKFVVDELDFCCPVCKRAFENEAVSKKKTELEANFNTSKANQLESINTQGAALKKKLDSIAIEVKINNEQLEVMTKSMSTLLDQRAGKQIEIDIIKPDTETVESLTQAKISQDLELINLKDQANDIEKVIHIMTGSLGQTDTTELQTEKATIKSKIDELKTIQSQIEVVAKANDRINELKALEKSLAHEQAQIEREEFLISKFNKSLIEGIESKVNAMFEIANFKMFEQQINGGETETCICTVKGVPYNDLNNAMKIQAGLDIIKTLSGFYKVSAPIFIDNRESVVDIGEQTAQIINLVVSEQDKELRIV